MGTFDVKKVTLEEVLDRREARAAQQEAWLARLGSPLLSCSMNMPGDVKRTPLIDYIFQRSMEEVKKKVGPALLDICCIQAPTGPECLLAVEGQGPEWKEVMVALEETLPAGRLLDLDVLDGAGIQLSRQVGRACLICGGPAAACARSRAHGLVAVRAAAEALLMEAATRLLSRQAVGALRLEAELTPKPGLVDARNCGSHKDMDLALLLASASSLEGYFSTCVSLGFEEVGRDDGQGIGNLVWAGIQAEERMLAVTGGVNTHRGAIYALGLYLFALAGYLKEGGSLWARCRQAAARQHAHSPRKSASHGSRVEALYRVGGARQEALAGFPSARLAAKSMGEGASPLEALLAILALLEDTNLLHRGGPEALDFVREEAGRILELPPAKRKDALFVLDEECIAKGISPGGAADMLALSLLMLETAPQALD